MWPGSKQVFYPNMWQNRLDTKTNNNIQRGTLHFIKGDINQEDSTILNIYAPNSETPDFI